MQVQTYLFFDGNCEEAVSFYREALGAEVQAMMRYSDSPEPLPPGMVPEGKENQVMHTSFRIGETTIMASDAPCGDARPQFGGFSLSLDAADETEARRLFDTLAEGGTVSMPLDRTFFSPCFGMLTDCFGVSWMVIVPGEDCPENAAG
ncbi:VOC family protein [Fodinicurvata sediminis]|uniref:VOC family protein n=1 Tax=Fodinicurvata sediminis TaxID=1121832 RepID=UPI0003B66618|nr:VOC family protein [Fodinicurvata sediminis]